MVNATLFIVNVLIFLSILYTDGQISVGNGENLSKLFNAGYDAIKKIDTNTKVIAHASSSKDTTIYKTFFDALYNNGAKWDIIGLSSYPWPSGTWKTPTIKYWNA